MVRRATTQKWADDQLRLAIEQTARAMFKVYTTEYEKVRKPQKGGDARTRRMQNIMDAVVRLAVLFSVKEEYPWDSLPKRVPECGLLQSV
jgi:hypothetical protein